MNKIGAQLYTVRSLMLTPEETLRVMIAIKALGYQSVQLYGNMEQMVLHAKCAREAGIEIDGACIDMNVCEASEEQLFALCREYQIANISISSHYGDYDDTDAYIARVNAFGAKAKRAGIAFSYHNHSHEFIKLDGKECGMSRFLKGFDKENVGFMPDTYWLQDGGYDVRYFLEQTAGRVNILHVKDMKRLEQGHIYTEVGNGNLYIKGILKTAQECGIHHFVVEQDICEGDPLDSLKQSYEYIHGLLEES